MNLLGIDFEEWYHPELIQQKLSIEKKTPKIINGVEKIIDLLRKNDTLATFFVVGELIEYKPELLDIILENDHEIGFHTMHHTKLESMGNNEKFENELKEFEKLSEGKSKGFRAPTFSLNYATKWAINSLIRNNYVYDSSIVPVETSMYGIKSSQISPYKISTESIEKNDPNGKLIEFPLLVTKFLGKKIPAGGGFYLRTLPLKTISNAIQDYEKKEIPTSFYIHSWELASEYMPKVTLPMKDHFITYHNLNKAYSKMEKLLKTFKFTSFEKYLLNKK